MRQLGRHQLRTTSHQPAAQASRKRIAGSLAPRDAPARCRAARTGCAGQKAERRQQQDNSPAAAPWLSCPPASLAAKSLPSDCWKKAPWLSTVMAISQGAAIASSSGTPSSGLVCLSQRRLPQRHGGDGSPATAPTFAGRRRSAVAAAGLARPLVPPVPGQQRQDGGRRDAGHHRTLDQNADGEAPPSPTAPVRVGDARHLRSRGAIEPQQHALRAQHAGQQHRIGGGDGGFGRQQHREAQHQQRRQQARPRRRTAEPHQKVSQTAAMPPSSDGRR